MCDFVCVLVGGGWVCKGRSGGGQVIATLGSLASVIDVGIGHTGIRL